MNRNDLKSVFPEKMLSSLSWVRQMENAQEYAVGWGTLALINAGIAQGKNRRGLNWFLLSVLLGPPGDFHPCRAG